MAVRSAKCSECFMIRSWVLTRVHSLPVTDLWLDIFEKIKALGFNCVSFYVHWGYVEYKKDSFDFEGIRSYEPFFKAAREAGVYLIARPGPYINAETSGKRSFEVSDQPFHVS